MAKVRRVNVEGSTFDLRRAKGSVKTKERVSKNKGKVQDNQTKGSVESKERKFAVEEA